MLNTEAANQAIAYLAFQLSQSALEMADKQALTAQQQETIKAQDVELHRLLNVIKDGRAENDDLRQRLDAASLEAQSAKLLLAAATSDRRPAVVDAPQPVELEVESTGIAD